MLLWATSVLVQYKMCGTGQHHSICYRESGNVLVQLSKLSGYYLKTWLIIGIATTEARSQTLAYNVKMEHVYYRLRTTYLGRFLKKLPLGKHGGKTPSSVFQHSW